MKKTTQKQESTKTFAQILSEQVINGRVDIQLLEIGYQADRKNGYKTNYMNEALTGFIASMYLQHLNTCVIEVSSPQLANQLVSKLNYCKYSNNFTMFMNKDYQNDQYIYTFTFNIDLKELNSFICKELNNLFVGLNLEPTKETLVTENKIKNDELQELNNIIASCGYSFEL